MPRAHHVVILLATLALASCVRTSYTRQKCARICQQENDRCLTAATQSAEIDTCKQKNVTCVDACP